MTIGGEDIFTLVPGLAMSGGLEGENRYSIRGLSSQTGGTGYFLVGATVGVYLDGTPVTAALGPDNQVSGNLFDIERVEVLKGPQGTLFGEGSQGGTIRFLYKQPDATKFDAAVNASYSTMEESDDNSHRLDAMVNVPFGDGFALRLVGWTSERAGFIDNIDPFEADYNKGDTTGGRAVVRYEGERFAVTGSLYRNDQGTTGGSATVRAYEASSFRVEGFYPESHDEIDIYSFTVEVDFPWANFLSLTSFTDRQVFSIAEFPLEFRDVLDFYYGGASQASDHPETTFEACRANTELDPRCFGPQMDALLRVPANTHTDFLEEYAVFGEVTYDLTPTLEATVGVRVSSLEQFFDYSQTGTDDTPVSPKVNLSWRPRNELLVYFNYATGFRPGNVNSHMQFNVDESTAPELTSGEDNELLHAPGYSASLAVDYEIPVMRDWTVTLHADHAWVDGHFADAGNTRPVAKWRKANASATARSGNGKWRLALFATNLGNAEILRTLQGSAVYYWHAPRQIGLEVGYRM